MSLVHSVDDDWVVKIAHKAIVAPSNLPLALAGIAVAAGASLSGVTPTDADEAIAASLASGTKSA